MRNDYLKQIPMFAQGTVQQAFINIGLCYAIIVVYLPNGSLHYIVGGGNNFTEASEFLYKSKRFKKT